MKSELSRFPAEFLERLKKMIPPGLQPSVWQGFIQPRPTVFRVNPLQASPSQVFKELDALHFKYEPVSGFPHAYIIRKGSHKKLSESRSFQNGWIYLQGLTSQLPPLALNPQPGERVLDMAAAPGGKTTYLAALMKNQGEIVACEPDPIRFDRMVFNLKRQGATIVSPLQLKGEKLGVDYREYFDRILLDAPCSSEGTFIAQDRKTYSHWSVDFIRKASVLQKKLLAAAIPCLKPAGKLLYSTCSLSPEENEAVIDWALSQFPGFMAQALPLNPSYLRPPLAQWEGRRFHPSLSKARRVYPSLLMEGFFLCLLWKDSSFDGFL